MRAPGGQPEEWNPDIKPWPKLNPAAMPGVVGQFVRLATENSEADPAAVLATLLARFAVEVGTGPSMMVGDARHFARLFAIVVGKTSKARKGTSAAPIERLFSEWPEDYALAAVTGGPLATGEGLIWSVRDNVMRWKCAKDSEEGEWIVEHPGIEDKRLFVLDQELKNALQMGKREGSTLSAIVRSMWDSGTVAPLIKNSRYQCSNAHVGIVSHVTFDELQESMARVELSNGFANRFLWVCARRSKVLSRPQPMAQDDLTRLRVEFLSLAEHARAADEMAMTTEAEAAWDDIYHSLATEHDGPAGAVIDRAEAQCLRLAMVYALLDGQAIIAPTHLEGAKAFWDYCEASALYIFSDAANSPVAAKVMESLEAGPKTATELHKAMHNHAHKTDLQRALQDLTAAGKVEAEKRPGKGRPATVFALAKQKTQPEQWAGPTEVAV